MAEGVTGSIRDTILYIESLPRALSPSEMEVEDLAYELRCINRALKVILRLFITVDERDNAVMEEIKKRGFGAKFK